MPDTFFAGPGAVKHFIKIMMGASPCPNAKVWVCDSAVSSVGSTIGGWWLTDNNGYVNGAANGVYFDASTVYIFVISPQANFVNPTTWVVTDGANASTGTAKTVTGTPVNPAGFATLGDVLAELRNRLNDLPKGNFTDAMLVRHINARKRDTEVLARCHKPRMDFTLTDGLYLYYFTPFFEVKAIRMKSTGKPLSRCPTGMLTTGEEDDAEPRQWAPYSGSGVQVGPTPDTSYDVEVEGYAVTEDIGGDPTDPSFPVLTDVITSIPSGIALTTLVDGAEQLARYSRNYGEESKAKADAVGQRWSDWCKISAGTNTPRKTE